MTNYLVFPSVCKSLVLPESLSVHSSFMLCYPSVFLLDIELLKRRTFGTHLLSPASFLHHTTVTDERA